MMVMPTTGLGTQEALGEVFAKHGISGARLPVSGPPFYCFSNHVVKGK